eukprot:TRINITY_DN17833_c0_g1_i1.p1 TRINITY_DN17833_c0_g1~~TRINITY_DN17833_c0_g1_i1.p1  ORF type:complete len:168 (-),score=3.38 TRINITY_DN17833_c0_g1_i1:102-605(-)
MYSEFRIEFSQFLKPKKGYRENSSDAAKYYIWINERCDLRVHILTCIQNFGLSSHNFSNRKKGTGLPPFPILRMVPVGTIRFSVSKFGIIFNQVFLPDPGVNKNTAFNQRQCQRQGQGRGQGNEFHSFTHQYVRNNYSSFVKRVRNAKLFFTPQIYEISTTSNFRVT